ncbi:TonB-dependent receptor [Neisseriaceae bacterium TC5R-5]|nr:TonB-dependent receptor [Neisseriaceae bacterium TC5R-5]
MPALEVQAADEPSTGQLERVEVTGSSIRRTIKQEKALPVTIMRPDELAKQGLTTVEQVINTLSTNQSSMVAASSVATVSGGASYASLRGLGSQYTLVLLDGRRVASQAVGGYATDLNAIPLAAIERIEVLRDGASAIYGSDAIGGVINFITKRSITGVTIGGDVQATQRSGGGSGSVQISGGIGELAEDNYNLYGALSYQKTERVTTLQRDFANKYFTADNLSSRVFPFNYTYRGNAYNPTAPACRPPFALPLGATTCGEQAGLYMDLTPEVEQLTGTLKATRQIGEHTLSLQYVGAQNTSTTAISPVPLIQIATLRPGDKYYPSQLPDGTPTDGSPIVLNGRASPLGPRVTESLSTTQRLAFNAEGLLADWDYRGGAAYSQNETTIHYQSGYVYEDKIRNALIAGDINPFGDSLPGAWKQVELSGDGWQAKYTTVLADFKVSKEILELPAGNLATAFGVEARSEKLDSQIRELAKQAIGSGIAGSQSTSGSRTVTAMYAEAEVPIVKSLEAQLAARYDRYSDFGSAFNPKIAFKYQPIPSVLLRSSASKGFRAPTLYDVYQPDATTYTAQKFNDPLRCPGGSPANGGNVVDDCNQQFEAQQGGSRDLSPEKSSSLTLGIVIEPVPEVTASADLWWTQIENMIGVLDPGLIFADPTKYADKFVRNPDGSLKYVVTTTQNLGNLSAAGVDVSLAWRLPKNALGNFTLNLDGSYTSKYAQQMEKGGAYYSSLGGWYQDAFPPTVRWKHSLALNWRNGPWGALLVQNYSAGYTDMNSNGEEHRVSPYILWNLSGSYLWQKKLSITAGIRNLFDRDPPFSNQTNTFQYGFDPVIADPTGRAFFLKASYKL